ncbi:MAG: hypothetical protein M1834_009177 [Cirrosporium novae-zelandiae]|nr:MAG: hypothetical protein M1834_009177 [Cirrosporium novae-zelandiae]
MTGTKITASFVDKTVIVTGSNTGIGYEAALKYTELGASKVILSIRNNEKGQRAKNAIEEKTQRKGLVEVWKIDIDRYESIVEFASRVDRELPRVDIAFLNAGVLAKDYSVSLEGWEKMMQINLLSTALLTILLLDKLKASKAKTTSAHLTIIASTGHKDIKPKASEKDQMLHSHNTGKGYSMMNQCSLSKLFMMWMTRELAARCIAPNGGPEVIINDTTALVAARRMSTATLTIPSSKP